MINLTLTRPQIIARILYRQIHISNWNESDIIVDRKSRFQARHTDLYDSKDISEILQLFLSEHKSIAKNASHPHILAWRTGVARESSLEESKGRKATKKDIKRDNKKDKKDNKKGDTVDTGNIIHNQSNFHMKQSGLQLEASPVYYNIQQGFSDNGEKGAGAKLLEHLVNQNIINKLVIVTRWYGGSPIGSLRFRHISNSAFDSLRRAKPTTPSK